jgi:hypothetical protein
MTNYEEKIEEKISRNIQLQTIISAQNECVLELAGKYRYRTSEVDTFSLADSFDRFYIYIGYFI